MDKERIEKNLKELLNYLFSDLRTYERIYEDKNIQHEDEDNKLKWYNYAESCQKQILSIIDDLISLYKD